MALRFLSIPIFHPVLLGCAAAGLLTFSAGAQQALSLEQVVNIAIENDPWLKGSQLQQSAVEARSEAAGTLPDPMVSVGVMNLPTDGWRFDQEPMTQFKVGVSQMFPRGDTLAIRQGRLAVESTKFPLLREDRKAKVQAMVSQMWLDVFQAQSTINLIESDKALFEQLTDVTRASYASAAGKTRQQDVIRAQLELVQLDDRLTVERQKLETASARLNEWLHQFDSKDSHYQLNFSDLADNLVVTSELPDIRPHSGVSARLSRNELAQVLAGHPLIRAVDVTQQVADKDIELAKQQYKPQWGVNASYAYRDDAPNGSSRADFFSVGVTFDVPLFSEQRQDKEVSASVAKAESVKTEKLLQIKTMMSQVDAALSQLKRLRQRQALYDRELLAQMREQAEASLTAYTNDDGDFAEVIRARIAELNGKIVALQIHVDALKAITQLNYFFTQSGHASRAVSGGF